MRTDRRAHDPTDVVSARDRVALDALTFFIADVQTGFGPFIAVFLATSGWSDGEIGRALSIGTIAAVISQLPGGALVDRLRDKRLAAGAACLCVALAAVMFALSSAPGSVMAAEILHSFGSAMLGPAVAAISLALVGRAALGARLGRNARFAALGNGAAAAVLGTVGAYLSPRSVFWLTAGFMGPGLAALWMIRPPARSPPEEAGVANLARSPVGDLLGLLRDRRIVGFATCVSLFHLSNAALLPLAAANLAHSIGQRSNAVIALAVVVPQAIVAAISPIVGRMADARGPRLVLTIGFCAVPLRAVLLAVVADPWGVVAVQALDGIGAATFGIMVPLVAADLTRRTQRFNLCLGLFGLATAAGATVSTSLAGAIADRVGNPMAFITLAGCGLLAVIAAWLAAPRRRGGPQNATDAEAPA